MNREYRMVEAAGSNPSAEKKQNLKHGATYLQPKTRPLHHGGTKTRRKAKYKWVLFGPQAPGGFIQGRVSIFRTCLPSRKMRARKNKDRRLENQPVCLDDHHDFERAYSSISPLKSFCPARAVQKPQTPRARIPSGTLTVPMAYQRVNDRVTGKFSMILATNTATARVIRPKRTRAKAAIP